MGRKTLNNVRNLGVVVSDQLRTYLDIMDYYINGDSPLPILTEADIIEEDTRVLLTERLQEAVFKLRAHSDTTGGEYSLGFESGLEMAASIIENILRNVEEK